MGREKCRGGVDVVVRYITVSTGLTPGGARQRRFPGQQLKKIVQLKNIEDVDELVKHPCKVLHTLLIGVIVRYMSSNKFLNVLLFLHL